MDQPPRTPAKPTTVIVDPAINDYDALLASPYARDRNLLFVGTGEAALRLPVRGDAVWLINIDLPDMTGPELVRELRAGTRRPTVCLIANQYDDEDERASRACGAALYLCKPLPPKWFRHLAELAGKREGQRFELEPRPPTGHEAA